MKAGLEIASPHRLESAKQRYFDTVGQKMQTKAAPIRDFHILSFFLLAPVYSQILCHYQAIGFNRFKLRPLITLVPHPYHGVLNDILGFCPIQGYSERQSKEFILQRQNIVSEADLLHLYNNDGLGYEKLQTPITFF